MPLYLAAERPVVERDGMLIMRDDDRMPLLPGETEEEALGAVPLAGLLPAERGGGVPRRDASTTSSPRCARPPRRNARAG